MRTTGTRGKKIVLIVVVGPARHLGCFTLYAVFVVSLKRTRYAMCVRVCNSCAVYLTSLVDDRPRIDHVR